MAAEQSETPKASANGSLLAASQDAIRARIVDAALKAAACDGWSELSLGAIARQAGVRLSDLYRHFGSKHAILAAYVARIDLAILDETAEPGGEDAELSAHDRLFDAVLARFEAMEDERDALRVIWHDLLRDPVEAARLLPAATRSCRWTLEAAGIPTSGFAGAVRVRALLAVAAQTFRVWLDDDGADLAKTMADLDRRLHRAERVLLPKRMRGNDARDGRKQSTENSPED
jgi:AcrR family transcriptional regulator